VIWRSKVFRFKIATASVVDLFSGGNEYDAWIFFPTAEAVAKFKREKSVNIFGVNN
jgi:hypothetical protein